MVVVQPAQGLLRVQTSIYIYIYTQANAHYAPNSYPYNYTDCHGPLYLYLDRVRLVLPRPLRHLALAEPVELDDIPLVRVGISLKRL